jgi:hypothetical protein
MGNKWRNMGIHGIWWWLNGHLRAFSWTNMGLIWWYSDISGLWENKIVIYHDDIMVISWWYQLWSPYHWDYVMIYGNKVTYGNGMGYYNDWWLNGDIRVISWWSWLWGGAIIDAWMRLAYVEIYSFKLQNPQWFSMSLNCCCLHIKLGIRLKKENIVEFCGNLHGRAQRLGFAITTVWKEQPNFWGLKMAEALAKLRNHLPSAKLT